MHHKIIKITNRRTVHTLLLPEWDRPYALKRRKIQDKFTHDRTIMGSMLADLFSNEINKELTSIGNMDELDILVTLYRDLIPYSITTEEESAAFQRLSVMTLSEIRKDLTDNKIWNSITLYKQFVHMDARKLIKKLDKDLNDPKARELYGEYFSFMTDPSLMY